MECSETARSALVGGVQQDSGEGVVVIAAVTQEAAFGQDHFHRVSGGQHQRLHAGAAVLLVLAVEISEDGGRLVVHHHGGAGRQVGSGGARVAVHCQGEKVHAGAGSNEDAVEKVVVSTQVEEDVPVDDDLVAEEGPQTPATVGESHGEGTAAG